jgi:hypothetical protein
LTVCHEDESGPYFKGQGHTCRVMIHVCIFSVKCIDGCVGQQFCHLKYFKNYAHQMWTYYLDLYLRIVTFLTMYFKWAI